MKKVLLLIFAVMMLVSDASNTYAQKSDKEWQLVFSDEFNQKNGSMPNPDYWSCSRRGTSTWNRWISKDPSVAFIRKGKLVCRAIRNTVNPADTALMLTGAVETRGKYSFQYGRIEVRAKTNLHPCNFPAIWLMPEPPAPKHPYGGEIDIFESYGTKKAAHQTVHSHWTLNLKHNTNPKNTVKKTDFDISKWHVYGLEWMPDRLIFMIDGKVTYVYKKSESADALANQQWPFDHPFYIILNQSLRRTDRDLGSPPDQDYIYETQFDWVRVYQKKTAK